MQLVGVLHLGPGLLADPRDGLGVQGGQAIAGLHVQGAPGEHRLSAALLQGSVVEKGIGLDVEDLMAEGGWLQGVPRHELQPAFLDVAYKSGEPVDVHRLGQAISDRLLHQGMVRQRYVSHQVFLACHLLGKDCRQQVVGPHPYQRMGHLLTALLAQNGQSPGGVPSPSGGEHRSGEEGLDQHLLCGGGAEVGEDLLQGEAVLRSQGEDDGVLIGGGLELEVKGPTETLAQGQAPGPVDAPAKGGVDHHLHAPALIEEALQHNRILGRNDPQRLLLGGQVLGKLLRGGQAEPPFLHQPTYGSLVPFQQSVHLLSQARNSGRELGGAGRSFPQPEGDGGREPMGVFHSYHPRLHPENAP